MRPILPCLAVASLTLPLLASTAAWADVAPNLPISNPPAPVNGSWPAPTPAAPPPTDSASPVNWIVVALMVIGAAITLWSIVRLLRRTGHSGWWALLMFVPLVNCIGFWVWAFTPNGKRPTNP